MPNKTVAERLAREAPGLSVVAGHFLVVYETVGEGRVFRALLQPGEPFQRRRWRKYFAYAVSADPTLQMEFRDRIIHQDQIHSFDLTFTVDYFVRDAHKLTDKLDTDPLQRLEDRIKRVIGRAIAQEEWDKIRSQTEFKDVERAVLRSGDPNEVDSTTNLDRIREFADDLGIGVKTIELTRRLLEEDLKPDIATKEAELEAAISQVEHERTKQRRQQESELQEDEIRRQQSLRRTELNGKATLLEEDLALSRREQMHEAQLEFQQGMLKAFNTAVRNLSDGIENADDFSRSADAALQILEKIRNSAVMQPDGHPETKALQEEQKFAAIGLTPPAHEAEFHRLFVDGLAQIKRWTCPAQEKRQLLSAILHLLAELVLAEHARSEVYESHAAEVTEIVSDLIPPEDVKQFARCLLDYDKIMQHLGSLV